MPVFSGNTTGSVTQVAYNIPSGVMSFSLVMNTGGSLAVSVNNIKIFSADSLDSGDKVYNDAPITILRDTSIFLITSGDCDYYFSIT